MVTGFRLRSLQCLSPAGFHRMAYREWGDPANPQVLLCVHGLTRAASDFDVVAAAMADRYRVICPDIAGRGASDRLADGKLYGVGSHANDVATLMATLEAQRLDFLGTSMGGLVGVVLAGMPGSPIRRLLVNDIGPEISAQGVERIKTYVGKDPHFATQAEGVAYLNELTRGFGSHTAAQNEALNRPLVVPQGDGWGLHYDPALGTAFKSITPQAAKEGEAVMWRLWEGISAEVLVTRGVSSDLLTPETVEQMVERGRHVRAVEIAEAGHAPAFVVPAQLSVVREFFA